MSLAIFFSFYRINFRGSCDSCESQLPLFWTIYFPTAPFSILISCLGYRRLFQGFYQLFHLISFQFPLRVCHKLSSPVEARNFSVVRTCVIR